jgi:Transposase DDE domain
MAGLSRGLRAAHDDLQSVRSLGSSGHPAPLVRALAGTGGIPDNSRSTPHISKHRSASGAKKGKPRKRSAARRQSLRCRCLRDLPNARTVEPVILSTASRKRPYPLDRRAYRRRNRIERMFCRIKDWRRIATRYDRLAGNYLSALALVAIACFWAT